MEREKVEAGEELFILLEIAVLAQVVGHRAYRVS
jgi:hypothetical protein